MTIRFSALFILLYSSACLAQSTVKPKAGTTQTKPSAIVIGMLADTVLAQRGKAMSTAQVGRDDSGLLVEWRYPDETYLMGRRLHGGVEAYRVIKITPQR